MAEATMLKNEALVMLRLALENSNADFREGQWEAIESLVSKRARMLVVQRTGWGKSIVYFITTRLLRNRGSGPTLLVSPLLSLMRNQLLAAERLDLRAETVNSTNENDWEDIFSRVRANQIDLLIISPERLANENFRDKVLMPMMSLTGLFVVDEAHCISDWGHDFRPDYQRIARILQLLPSNVPMLATTATANSRVVADVQSQLGDKVILSRGPLVRESLQLQNITLVSQAARLAWLAEHVPNLRGSGIIYALTVSDTEIIAGWLQSQGINAHAYHGGQISEVRENLEQRLLANRVKALVATTALGMGFDKPDLGFVVHFQRPGSVVHYYQQVGRAGRAVDRAHGILLSGREDGEIIDYFISTAFPPETHIQMVLGALQHIDSGLYVRELEQRVNLGRSQIDKVLKALSVRSPAPVVQQKGRWYATPIPYKAELEKQEQITNLRRHEQVRMLDYMANQECLMMFLERELDDPYPAPCGKCAVCLGEPVVPRSFSQELALKAVQHLRRGVYNILPRTKCPEGALPSLGWTTAMIPIELRCMEGRALCLWGDDGWGKSVRLGKTRDGHFSDELVEAAAALIQQRWKPQPVPTWVTCVPSLGHPNLVPDFSKRLAKQLGLPFLPCITKTKATMPQKAMENSFKQANNLDGVFSVTSAQVLRGPVLLIDDMVDSRWTFTVCAALLRSHGSGPIFPFALCETTKS